MPKQFELNAAASWISRFTAAIIVIIALGLISISAWMAYRLGASFGRTTEEAMLYGTASALISLLGAAMSFMVGHKWRQGRRGAAAASAIIMVLCLTFSFMATTGFSFGARTQARDAQFLQAELNRSKLTSLQASQKDLERINETLRMPNLPARERRANEERIRELEANVRDQQTKLALAPAVLTATSQVDVLARIMGQDPELITFGLVALLALINELAGVALSLALGNFWSAMPAKAASTADPAPLFQKPLSALRNGHANSKVRRSNLRPFRNSKDIEAAVTEFFQAWVETAEGSTIDAGPLYKAFAGFCRNNGWPKFTQRAFGLELSRRGLPKDRRTVSGRVRYLNLRLNESEPSNGAPTPIQPRMSDEPSVSERPHSNGAAPHA
jgi:hypothetical protein